MIADKVLEYYGHNLAAYPVVEDRWMVAFSDVFLSTYKLFPVILAAIPWIYFVLRKEKHSKNRKLFLRKIIIASILGFIFGLAIPYLLLAILGSLAAYSLYGGTI